MPIRLFGQNLSQNVVTQDLSFDSLFKVISSSNSDANLHLTDNTRQKLIDLAQKRETIFISRRI